MKASDLHKAMSGLKDEYILEAAPAEKVESIRTKDSTKAQEKWAEEKDIEKKPRIIPFYRKTGFRAVSGLVAACFLFVIGIGVYQSNHALRKNDSGVAVQEKAKSSADAVDAEAARGEDEKDAKAARNDNDMDQDAAEGMVGNTVNYAAPEEVAENMADDLAEEMVPIAADHEGAQNLSLQVSGYGVDDASDEDAAEEAAGGAADQTSSGDIVQKAAQFMAGHTAAENTAKEVTEKPEKERKTGSAAGTEKTIMVKKDHLIGAVKPEKESGEVLEALEPESELEAESASESESERKAERGAKPDRKSKTEGTED